MCGGKSAMRMCNPRGTHRPRRWSATRRSLSGFDARRMADTTANLEVSTTCPFPHGGPDRARSTLAPSVPSTSRPTWASHLAVSVDLPDQAAVFDHLKVAGTESTAEEGRPPHHDREASRTVQHQGYHVGHVGLDGVCGIDGEFSHRQGCSSMDELVEVTFIEALVPLDRLGAGPGFAGQRVRL